MRKKMHHKKATKCYVCDCSFTDKNRKVRYHCHVLGNYQGAACNTCKFRYENDQNYPCYFP